MNNHNGTSHHFQAQVFIENARLINDSFVQYNIHIQILKSGNVTWDTHIHKRFSDFINLRQGMINELGNNSEFPYELPNKQFSLWNNKQTNISSDVIEERKVKLAKFLYDMLNDSFDSKWRNTDTVAKFLNIPKRWNSMASTGSSHAINTFETGEDENNWLSTFRDCKNDLQMSKKLTSGERTRKLIQLRLKINHLEKLLNSKDEEELEKSELERRQNLLKVLKQDINELSLQPSYQNESDPQLNNIPTSYTDTSNFTNRAMNDTTTINSGIRPQVGRRRLGETEVTAQLNNQQLLSMHKDTMKVQDQELMDLHKIIQKQKAMSIQMNQELSEQNEMLDIFSNDIDQTANKLKTATRRATKFNDSM
ncbi:hypothetical protein C6P45_003130 [Maudiozyma exigua]|uniref:PX domain-containing protein n=1 Tax=Maudiozyma exigua TaxID=34358 RepID=A0A9P7B2T9_MAUEX|nr:hypothetical protein C6P45_003130 [Kazachstania exigua]